MNSLKDRIRVMDECKRIRQESEAIKAELATGGDKKQLLARTKQLENRLAALLPESYIELDNTFIENRAKGSRRPPKGEPWRFYLFVRDVKKGKPRKRWVEVVEGRTRAEAIKRLEEFVCRQVVLIA